MARIIGEVRPRFVFVENSPMLVCRGLDTVLSDLAEMGYDARWGIVSAADAGAPHVRKRIWIVAYTDKDKLPFQRTYDRQNLPTYNEWDIPESVRLGTATQLDYWERKASQLDDGISGSMGELAALGNAQVPAVAALAWKILTGEE